MTKADDLETVPPPPRPSRRPVLMLVGATALAVLGYGVAAIVVLGEEPSQPPVFAQPPPPRSSPAVETPPVSLLPAPPTEPAEPTRDVEGVRAEGTGRPGRGTATPSRTAASPVPDPAFTVGRTVGVGMAGVNGYRLRNRDFVARIEADGTAKGPSGRFTVRQGLGDGRCVSFESAEFPGFYLRHRNYVLLVERAEQNDLFRYDATFCPVASAGGFALRSVNFPDHHLIHADGLVRLVPSAPVQATVFRALPPI
ncbi:hypothetical protein Ait01nite_075700 [Actinoplanes italicus]|uniref:Alpha-L-arabinofuranosidase B-like protein n=1 Tax=Actinoplanes italicus TaxID=113567 RepID=A0A2T0JYP8_9ACTN|nr:AbfB domain-containing protein [Actinoplanes italicus]PRX14662.1 alpha-L-arabinofuranosidase B-like protein [Actinoplanes italicus]GIE34525.1 hypothetical protein Ait01nite_075700 [Actinoplanes italicus]